STGWRVLASPAHGWRAQVPGPVEGHLTNSWEPAYEKSIDSPGWKHKYRDRVVRRAGLRVRDIDREKGHAVNGRASRTADAEQFPCLVQLYARRAAGAEAGD